MMEYVLNLHRIRFLNFDVFILICILFFQVSIISNIKFNNMAFYNPASLSQEELCCPICFEDFDPHIEERNPKLLMCLHTYCLGCCETLRKYDGTLQCSICRVMHKDVRITDLLDNYVIVNYLR